MTDLALNVKNALKPYLKNNNFKLFNSYLV